MNKYFIAMAAAGSLAACANQATQTQLAEAPSCEENVYTTGSMIARKQKCAPPASEEDRGRAQDAAREMRDEQLRRASKSSVPGGI